MKIFKKAAKGVFSFAAFLVFLIIVYWGVAFLTARISGVVPIAGELAAKNRTSPTVDIYLVNGLLHTDFAIPVTKRVLERFGFLRETEIPLANPNLKFLSFGWGSKAFYTTAGSYLDIKPTAVFSAVIGDRSVMRVLGLGVLNSSDDVQKLQLNEKQLERLLDFIERSFAVKESGERELMAGTHLQTGDAFFKAIGHFNLFTPCNQWVNEGLREAGVPLGVWTPTSQSLRHSLEYFSGRLTVQP